MLALVFIAAAVVGLLDSAAGAVGATSTDLLTFTSGADGLTVTGSASSKTGASVIQIGDYDGDGIFDFAVSGPASDSNAGLTVIVLGHSGSWADIDMSTVISGAMTRRVFSPLSNDYSGSSLGGAGDVNGDGLADLLVTAPQSGTGQSRGIVYVVFGKAGPYTDLTLGDSMMISNDGYAIYGSQTSTGLGILNSNSRGLQGDVNGDGIDDFVISAYQYDYKSRTNSGAVWLIYGSTVTPPVNLQLNAISTATGVLIGGALPHIAVGYSVDGAGDFNGDGIVDILFGAYQYAPVVNNMQRSNAGAAYLIYGARNMTEVDLGQFTTGSQGVLMLGGVAGEGAGTSVSGAGDINDDGIADILVGARNANSAAGKVYVVYGSTIMLTADIDFLAFTAGAMGFVVLGGYGGQYLGTSVSRAGDMNSDGVNDLLVGGFGSQGTVYIIYGTAATRTADINVLSGAGVYTFTRSGADSLYGGLDVNGDGYPDILVGDSEVNSNTGAAYMVLGPLPRTGTFNPTSQPSAQPTLQPVVLPTSHPSAQPSCNPTAQPTSGPSGQPSGSPTSRPSQPSGSPTSRPSVVPSSQPSAQPSAPSGRPSSRPTGLPSSSPSSQPSSQPSGRPTSEPSGQPTGRPSAQPSSVPSTQPTGVPSSAPSAQPVADPTSQPSALPTSRPSGQPSAAPSAEPTAQPSSRPTTQPSVQPTSQPTGTAAPTVEAVVESGGSTSAALSDGGIAGVVVGGVVFLALLGMILALALAGTAGAGASATTAAAAPATTSTITTADGAQYEMTSVEEVV